MNRSAIKFLAFTVLILSFSDRPALGDSCSSFFEALDSDSNSKPTTRIDGNYPLIRRFLRQVTLSFDPYSQFNLDWTKLHDSDVEVEYNAVRLRIPNLLELSIGGYIAPQRIVSVSELNRIDHPYVLQTAKELRARSLERSNPFHCIISRLRYGLSHRAAVSTSAPEELRAMVLVDGQVVWELDIHGSALRVGVKKISVDAEAYELMKLSPEKTELVLVHTHPERALPLSIQDLKVAQRLQTKLSTDLDYPAGVRMIAVPTEGELDFIFQSRFGNQLQYSD